MDSDTESEDDNLSSNSKEKTVPSPPPVHFFKSKKSSTSRSNEDENLFEKVKSKMTLHLKQKEHSNKISPKKLKLKQFKQEFSMVTPMQLSDEDWKENLPEKFNEDHDLQLCESSKSFTFEKQDDSAKDVIMTPQKNSKTFFSSSIQFSNDTPRKNLGNPAKVFSFQESQFNQHENSPTKSSSSQLSLSNSQLNNSPQSLGSQQSESNNSKKYRRELFTSSISSLKSVSDNSKFLFFLSFSYKFIYFLLFFFIDCICTFLLIINYNTFNL